MAPRLSKLASTISRDDSITVIGAGGSFASVSGDAPPLLGIWLMAHLCQESHDLPSPGARSVSWSNATKRHLNNVDIVIDRSLTVLNHQERAARRGLAAGGTDCASP